MSTLLSRREAMKLAGVAAAAAAAGELVAQDRPPAGAGTRPAGLALGDTYADGKYTLPPLPYAYNALDPLLNEETLKIHHDKHHAGYVNNLNKTLELLAKARQEGNYEHVAALSNALAFNGSGHVLHSLFWLSMNPQAAKAGKAPEVPAELAAAMNKSFGGVQAAQAQFAAATKAVEASGWGVLAYEPLAGSLVILQCEKHQNLTLWGVVPLLVCDVWEHAYYLQYQNRRPEWVDNFMKMADWGFAARRYAAAKGV